MMSILLKKSYKKNLSRGVSYKIAGVINSIRIRTTSNRDKLAQINLGDNSDNIDVIANNNLLDESIKRDDIVIIEGTLRLDDYTNRLNFRAKSIHSLEDARILYATGIKLKITNEKDFTKLSDDDARKINFLKIELKIYEEQKLINFLNEKLNN